MDTVWVWGDQLNRDLAHLRGRDPSTTRVLLVVSTAKLGQRRWHVQKAHLVVSAIRHFAAELEAVGYAVDLRRALVRLRQFVDAYDWVMVANVIGMGTIASSGPLRPSTASPTSRRYGNGRPRSGGV